MSITNPKEAAQALLKAAQEAKVKFPKVLDESKLMQTCGATIMLYKEGSAFNLKGALENLIDKFGQEEAKEEAPKPKKKRKTEEEAVSDELTPASPKKSKGPKKTETFADESNRLVGEAIKEMADKYFENKDARKGGVFSKAAKAIRESEKPITSAKEAMALKGVGKGIAGYIEEFLTTGSIQKLELLRSGFA